MFHKTRVFLAAVVGFCFLAVVTTGCEPDNENEVDCLESDCVASCAEKGFASGSCVDESSCECDGVDVGAYDWADAPPVGAIDAGPDAN
jgi:hypothetical protein